MVDFKGLYSSSSRIIRLPVARPRAREARARGRSPIAK